MIGATGFVRRPALEEALGRSELQVTAIARTPERLPAHSRMIARACDVHDADGLAEALRGHDAAIHAYSQRRKSWVAGS